MAISTPTTLTAIVQLFSDRHFLLISVNSTETISDLVTLVNRPSFIGLVLGIHPSTISVSATGLSMVLVPALIARIQAQLVLGLAMDIAEKHNLLLLLLVDI